MRISLEVLCEHKGWVGGGGGGGGGGGEGNVHPKGESSMVVPELDVSSEPGGPL